ncbi:uncharacterized protein TM35_001001080 [Trypanosoma theileri]|uniref:Mucin-associated surface protein (MASP) n=1 Tax=Trypanosoma theileri TaxID=67003 RepID=A0A1X0NEC2_9TRYP|nr:uncharacterized protein TM35_001001080 [Trypanosoma theileri]ORC82036.1 hypothetical protein TM35_001001080 [Trypanosoma theileri]
MMSIRRVLCVLTIALYCVCSYVVAAEPSPTDLGPKGEGGPDNLHSAASSCPSGSSAVEDGGSHCADSGKGNSLGQSAGLKGPIQQNATVNTIKGDHPEAGSVGSDTKHESAEKRQETEEVHKEATLKGDREASVDPANPGSSVAEVRGPVGVAAPSTSGGSGPASDVDSQRGREDLGSKAQQGDSSLVAEHEKGGHSDAKEEKDNLETQPQGENGESTGRNTTSSTNEESTTGTEENNENQQAEEGNGVQSTSPTSPAPTEGDATRDNVNTPNNDEESTTTTTTTTTTLPPELTNNKKGDADSSSSISSSVWVRVPLLIVVTLACILVC